MEEATPKTIPIELKEILPELCWTLRVIIEAVPLALERLGQGGVPTEKQREFWNALLWWEMQYAHMISRKGQRLPHSVIVSGEFCSDDVASRAEDLSDAAMELFPELSIRL